MKKYAIIFFFLFSFTLYAKTPGDIAFGPAAGMGSASNSNFYLAGAYFDYFLTETISAGTLIEWYGLNYSVNGTEYKLSYLPISLLSKYHFISESLKGSIFLGAGVFYSPDVSSKVVSTTANNVKLLNQYGLIFQLGYQNTTLLGNQMSLDLFLEYQNSLTKFTEQSFSTRTHSYKYHLILVKIGIGFEFSFNVKSKQGK